MLRLDIINKTENTQLYEFFVFLAWLFITVSGVTDFTGRRVINYLECDNADFKLPFRPLFHRP